MIVEALLIKVSKIFKILLMKIGGLLIGEKNAYLIKS